MLASILQPYNSPITDNYAFLNMLPACNHAYVCNAYVCMHICIYIYVYIYIYIYIYTTKPSGYHYEDKSKLLPDF